MNGETPAQIRPLFFGARLTGISKKGGGVRPIAVGCTLKRSVAKIASGSVIEDVGLSLNSRKFEVICENSEVHEHLLPSLPNSLYIDPSNATLLGSPLGDVACVSVALRAKVVSLSVMGERLRSFSAHDAILLLRYSFAIPKLLYLLQTAPCFLSSTRSEYDSFLCSIVSGICNASLSVSDHTWLQASISVRSGGLGFRSAVQLAPSAFLATAAVSFPVFCAILGAFKAPLIPFQEVALDQWSTTLVDVSPPSGDNAKLQRAWDFPHVAATFTSLCDGAPDPASRVCLMAVSSPHSGVPSRLEPSGLYRSDSKRPDGVTMVPLSSGKPLVWDATWPDTLAPFYERVAVCFPGAVAQAFEEKCAKYESLDCSYSFTPVAIETLGAIGPKSLSFLKKLGTRIREQTGEVSSFSYLLQRLSVAVQMANAISVMGTLPKLSYPDSSSL
uniref:Uncharacterized protein n=1 Tax=Amphimedon queenslandica TaxID=400682 RepID=A0A1X7V5Z3_AMPQE